MKSFLLGTAMCAVALIALNSRAEAANLVTNGSFETNGGVGELTVNTSASGWSVGATVDGAPYPFTFILDGNADDTGFPSAFSPPPIILWGPGSGSNNGFNGAADGTYFLGVDGAYATAPVYQDISGLTVGNSYTLSFQWAAAQFQTGPGGTIVSGPTSQSWSVSFGADTVSTPTFDLGSAGFSGWMSFTQTFVATSTTQTLSFLAVGTPSNLPPFPLLDLVDLEDTTTPPPPTVPEPAAVALLSLGLVGAGLVRRYRRRAAA